MRPKYGLIDPTEPVERGKGVLIAPLPRCPIYKGVPDASLLTEIELQKYEYHMPFYRQIKQMVHLGRKDLKEARRLERQARSRPIMEAMRKCMETEGLSFSQSSLAGKAVTYAYTRWDAMMRVLDDGRLLLDNNLAENESRPITLGRKTSIPGYTSTASSHRCRTSRMPTL